MLQGCHLVGHLIWRGQIFSRHQLRPHFTPERGEPNLVCTYEDRDGRIYRYLNDGAFQRLVGPDGRELYGRVYGAESVTTGLHLPGWPAKVNGEVLGLNPNAIYALFPGGADTSALRIAALQAGVTIKRFYETDTFAVLVLDRGRADAPTEGEIELTLNARYLEGALNGAAIDLSDQAKAGTGSPLHLSTTFPASLLLVRRPPRPTPIETELGGDWEDWRLVEKGTGLALGRACAPAKSRSESIPGRDEPLQFALARGTSQGEAVADYLIRPPSGASAVEIHVRNGQGKHGDGSVARLYVNGQVACMLDCAPRNPKWTKKMPRAERYLFRDTQLHRWTVPLGKHKGRPVLISVGVDPKDGPNADLQWVSRPRLIRRPNQAASAEILTDEGAEADKRTRLRSLDGIGEGNE